MCLCVCVLCGVLVTCATSVVPSTVTPAASAVAFFAILGVLLLLLLYFMVVVVFVFVLVFALPLAYLV